MTVEPADTRSGAVSPAAVCEPELAAVVLRAPLLTQMFEHAVQCFPEECCGLLFGVPDEGASQLVRCTNVQSHRNARGESELDARNGFWIDEKELLAALREAERQGQQLWGVYHSHVESEAYLSKTDLAGALGPDGEPLYPGAAHVVLSAWDDGVRDVTCFEWSTEDARYRGRAVERASA